MKAVDQVEKKLDQGIKADSTNNALSDMAKKIDEVLGKQLVQTLTDSLDKIGTKIDEVLGQKLTNVPTKALDQVGNKIDTVLGQELANKPTQALDKVDAKMKSVFNQTIKVPNVQAPTIKAPTIQKPKVPKPDTSEVDGSIRELGKLIESVLGERIGGVASKFVTMIPGAAMATAIGFVGKEVLDLGAKVASVSDKFAGITARIGMLKGEGETVGGVMDAIYASAERTRGSYYDMADTVSKLGITAKEAFNNTDEIIAFAEQLSMQFKIGGATLEQQNAAMLQLTQSMAAGKLQGDEFMSIMENAPLLARSIADEMGVSVGELKNMSSEGLITADVIKSALFNSAEETSAKFAEMPMTFAETGQLLSNEFLKSFEPVLEQFSSMTGTEEFKAVIDGLRVSIRGLALATQGAFAIIRGAFTSITSVVRGVASVFTNLFTAPTLGARALGIALVALTTYITLNRVATALLGTTYASLTVKQTALTIATNVSKAAHASYKAVVAGVNSIMVTYRALIISGAVATGACTTATALMRGAMLALRGSISLTTIATRLFNTVLRLNPIGIVITLLVALAAAFVGPQVAANGLGATLSDVWDTIVHSAAWGVNQVIKFINVLIGALNAVSSKINAVLKTNIGQLNQISEFSGEDVQGFSNKVKEVGSSFGNALTGNYADGAVPNNDGAIAPVGGGGGGGSGGGGGGAGGGGGIDSAQQELQQLQEDAKRVHDQIKDDYRAMFGTKVDEVEEWYRKELEELDKSKTANANYNADVTAINEMYARKREEAVRAEGKRIRELWNSVRDMKLSFTYATASTDSTGASSPITKLMKDQETALNELEDKYQGFSDAYAEMTVREQQEYIKMLDAKGVAYELSANNELTFHQNLLAEKLALEENYQKQRSQLIREGQEQEFLINEAMRTQNFEQLQSLLTDEYLAHQQAYEDKKQLMSDYVETAKNSQFDMNQTIFDSLMAGVDTLKDSLTGIIMGTTSLSKAFQTLAQTVLKSFISMWASIQIERLKHSMQGKAMAMQDAATQNAALASVLPNATAVAQQMSMATFGASATAGMTAYTSALAGMTATSSLTSSLGSLGGGFPSFGSKWQGAKLATGGLAYGETIAMIGEGSHDEAVLPLSDEVYSRIGEGINRNQGGGSNITLNVSAMDAHSFGDWLERGGGKVLRQFTTNTEREFGTEVGVW